MQKTGIGAIEEIMNVMRTFGENKELRLTEVEKDEIYDNADILEAVLGCS